MTEHTPTPEDKDAQMGEVIPFTGRSNSDADGARAEAVPSADHNADGRPDERTDGAADGSGGTPPDGPVVEGDVVRVDRPGPARADWLSELPTRRRERRPLVPVWARSWGSVRDTVWWVGEHLAHVSMYQVSRSPLYAVRLASRAPRGAVRIVGGFVRWTFDLEGEPVRLAAVRRADPEAYLKLSRQRDARVRLRALLAILVLIAALAVVVVLLAVSGPVRLVMLAAVVGVLGVAGAPADRPLIDRAVVPTRVEKLTSDMVIRALTSISIKGISEKDPDINFVAPITRDGPGWRADLDLPRGVTVADVLDKRDRMSGALRRPLGCIWPEGDATIHEGRLVLWVGDKDLSKTVVKSPLAKATTHDVFKGIPFGADPRGRPIVMPVIQHNTLIGSLPGQGKTSAVRVLAAGAALDPTVELWIHENKGTGDLDAFEKCAYRFVSGVQDEAIKYAADSFALLRREVMRRADALKRLPVDLCPDKRVTREIANRRSLKLHPLVAIFDECQNVFSHPQYGAKAGDDAEFVIKLGRALGVHLVLATQRPDKESLPTGVSANVSLRFCLKVGGQVENDMILGTSAYKNGIRATMFVPEQDAGTGYLVGATPEPKVTRTAYLDANEAKALAARAHAARKAAGRLAGHALGEATDDAAPAFDLLADILSVVGATEAKVWNETIVARLAELRPDAYGPWADLDGPGRAAQLTAALKPYGVRPGQVWGTTPDGKGANRTGIARDAITDAITKRDGKRESGDGG